MLPKIPFVEITRRNQWPSAQNGPLTRSLLSPENSFGNRYLPFAESRTRGCARFAELWAARGAKGRLTANNAAL
jgi:hypothetical protein